MTCNVSPLEPAISSQSSERESTAGLERKCSAPHQPLFPKSPLSPCRCRRAADPSQTAETDMGPTPGPASPGPVVAGCNRQHPTIADGTCPLMHSGTESDRELGRQRHFTGSFNSRSRQWPPLPIAPGHHQRHRRKRRKLPEPLRPSPTLWVLLAGCTPRPPSWDMVNGGSVMFSDPLAGRCCCCCSLSSSSQCASYVCMQRTPCVT